MTAVPSSPPPSPEVLAARHQALYDRVPSFACEPGCTACCGAIAMTGWEWDRVADKRHAPPGTLACPYAEDGSCTIHPDRPLVCRLFGAVADPRLTCPKGRGPPCKLTAGEARDLMAEHQQLVVDSAGPGDAPRQ